MGAAALENYDSSESVRDKGPEREEKSKEMSLTFRTAFPFEEFDNFQRRGRPERLKN